MKFFIREHYQDGHTESYYPHMIPWYDLQRKIEKCEITKFEVELREP